MDVVSGYQHTYALREDRTATCWGEKHPAHASSTGQRKTQAHQQREYPYLRPEGRRDRRLLGQGLPGTSWSFSAAPLASRSRDRSIHSLQVDEQRRFPSAAPDDARSPEMVDSRRLKMTSLFSLIREPSSRRDWSSSSSSMRRVCSSTSIVRASTGASGS